MGAWEARAGNGARGTGHGACVTSRISRKLLHPAKASSTVANRPYWISVVQASSYPVPRAACPAPKVS